MWLDGKEGRNGLVLSNVMHLSSFSGKEISIDYYVEICVFLYFSGVIPKRFLNSAIKCE